MWVKECGSCGNRNDRSLTSLSAFGFGQGWMVDQRIRDMRKVSEGEKECVVEDPLMTDIASRLETVEMKDWVDPIVVQETVGWLTVANQQG